MGNLQGTIRGERASLNVLAQICVGPTNLEVDNAPPFLQEVTRNSDCPLEVGGEGEILEESPTHLDADKTDSGWFLLLTVDAEHI